MSPNLISLARMVKLISGVCPIQNCKIKILNLKPANTVVVWACVSSSGVGNLQFIVNTMNKVMHLNILKANLQQSVEKLAIRDQFRFHQDNDPKDTNKSCVVQSWLIWNCHHLMQPPA